MKKFLLFIFLLTYTFHSSAHMAHYSKFNKIEMEILKDGEVIGYNYYFFTKKGDETIVTNQIKFSVKLLGATIFKIEGYGEERYLKNQLISYNSIPSGPKFIESENISLFAESIRINDT